MDDLEKRAEELKELSDAQKIIEEKEKALTTFEEKSLNEINFSDVKFKIDTNKDFDTQVETVLNGVVTASAVQDKDVQEKLKNARAEELLDKGRKKASEAHRQAVEAETEVQKAERDLYEAVLNTFGIYKHLPRFLMKILVFILSPIYIVLTLLIGIPCGLVKFVIDNLDGIVCNYNQTGDGVKPKIKTIFWIILGIIVLGAICLTILKLTGKI